MIDTDTQEPILNRESDRLNRVVSVSSKIIVLTLGSCSIVFSVLSILNIYSYFILDIFERFYKSLYFASTHKNMIFLGASDKSVSHYYAILVFIGLIELFFAIIIFIAIFVIEDKSKFEYRPNFLKNLSLNFLVSSFCLVYLLVPINFSGRSSTLLKIASTEAVLFITSVVICLFYISIVDTISSIYRYSIYRTEA